MPGDFKYHDTILLDAAGFPYTHLSSLHAESPHLFLQENASKFDPFLRTLDMILFAGPFVGDNNILHLEFSKIDQLGWCEDMKRVIFSWTESDYCRHDNNKLTMEISTQMLKLIELFESGNIIEGTLEAIQSVMNFIPINSMIKFS